LGVGEEGLEIGASVPLEDVAADPGVRSIASGLLAEAARRTRTEPWRRQATIAGRILEGDPTDLVVPSLLVLEARLRLLRDPDGPPEWADLETAFVGAPAGSRSSSRPGTGAATGGPAVPLVLSVVLRAPESGWGFALESVSRAALDAPIAAVAVGVRMRGSTIESARVATAALPSPRRAPRAEAALRGASLESMRAALAALEQDVAPGDDWRASAEYRLHTARVLLGRAVRRAAANAGM
jgi:xanthine dehydrogenase small subunit